VLYQGVLNQLQQLNLFTNNITMAEPCPNSILIPDKYDGTQDTLLLHSWLFQVKKYSLFHGLSQLNQVNIASSLLRGEAAIWWLAVERDVANGSLAIVTFAAFETAVKAQFEPRDYQFEYRTKLLCLHQGNLSVSAYAAEF